MSSQVIKKPPTDLSGRPITSERMKRHEALIRGLIKKFFPAEACFEASMTKFDLRNACRTEAFLSLCKFDEDKALNTVGKSTRKKRSDDDWLKWKRDNPEQALLECESIWVAQRVVNYLRRLRWKNSPQEKGGRMISFTALLVKANKQLDLDGTEISLFGTDSEFNQSEADMADEPTLVLDIDQAQADFQMLESIERRKGAQAMREAFNKLSEERRANCVAFLDQRVAAQNRGYRNFDFDKAIDDYEQEEAEGLSTKKAVGDDEDSF